MQSFNIIDGLESKTYSWRKSNPANPSGVQTSEVEVKTYSGSVTYLKNTLAPLFLAEGSRTMQVACSINAQGGGMGEMSVTRTYYDSAGGGDDGGDDGGGGGGSAPPAGQVGTTAENPVYDIQISENNIPILLHPKVKDANLSPGSAEEIALRMLSNGADENATFTTGTADKPVAHTVGEALSEVSAEVRALVSKQSSFLSAGMVLTVRWQIDGTEPAPDIGDFFRIATPEGPVGTPSGRNWLLAGGGATIEGDRVFMVKKYILSEPGGWDETIYGNE